MKKENTCLLISATNIQNHFIRDDLRKYLSRKFTNVYFVGDKKFSNSQHEILWKSALSRSNLFFELILFYRLLKIFLKYRPSNVISFSPKVNIYVGIISSILNIKHIPVVSGFGKYHSNFRKTSFIKILFKFSLYFVNCIVVMNKDNERTLKNLFPVKKIFLIPSEGYSGKNFYSNKNFSKNNIFYISRIIREKGIFNMLKAFIHLQKKYPDISLDVAGEVALNEKDLIEFNQLISNKNITFHGEISENLKYKIFEKVKIFAFPSVYGEGLPRVLLEAQIFKCLTLTTNFPGCEDAISPSMKMFLCSDTLKSTIESLEKAIMLEDKLLLKSITEEAQNWVNDHHNIPNIINKYSKIFSSTNFM